MREKRRFQIFSAFDNRTWYSFIALRTVNIIKHIFEERRKENSFNFS